MITLLAAVARHNVIGKNNDLPWYLPADLRHFKQLTTEQTVLMGRKTYESIVARLGKPLPNRQNLVLTRNIDYSVAEGVQVYQSLIDALQATRDIYVIGGAEIYASTIGQADCLQLTEIAADIDGDTYFPAVDPEIWQEVNRESHTKDDKNEYDYAFVTYRRR